MQQSAVSRDPPSTSYSVGPRTLPLTNSAPHELCSKLAETLHRPRTPLAHELASRISRQTLSNAHGGGGKGEVAGEDGLVDVDASSVTVVTGGGDAGGGKRKIKRKRVARGARGEAQGGRGERRPGVYSREKGAAAKAAASSSSSSTRFEADGRGGSAAEKLRKEVCVCGVQGMGVAGSGCVSFGHYCAMVQGKGEEGSGMGRGGEGGRETR